MGKVGVFAAGGPADCRCSICTFQYLQYLPVLQTAAAANCPLVRGGRGDRRRGGGGRREMALIKGKEREQGKEKGEVWGESRVRHKGRHQ